MGLTIFAMDFDVQTFKDQPQLLVMPVVLLAFMIYQLLESKAFAGVKEYFEKKPTFALHKYQKDFLDNMAKAQRLNGAGQALECIVKHAMHQPAVMSQIFDDFHCLHCGSVKPAEWINQAKGKKEPYKFKMDPEVVAFLGQEILVKVEKVGDPPTKQVVEGPKRADADKAARCCVDWAIKNYGATADGKFKAPKKAD